MAKVKDIVKQLKDMKQQYIDLRSLISDQYNDNQIDEAYENSNRLKRLKKDIEILENTDVEEVDIKMQKRV